MQQVELSVSFVLRATRSDIWDTLPHDIAHAVFGPGPGHEWWAILKNRPRGVELGTGRACGRYPDRRGRSLVVAESNPVASPSEEVGEGLVDEQYVETLQRVNEGRDAINDLYLLADREMMKNTLEGLSKALQLQLDALRLADSLLKI